MWRRLAARACASVQKVTAKMLAGITSVTTGGSESTVASMHAAPKRVTSRTRAPKRRWPICSTIAKTAASREGSS